MITLKLKEQLTIPLETEVLSPDQFLAKTSAEIAKMPVMYGNQNAKLGDFFTITGQDGDGEIHVEGDLERVKGIGTEMSQGRITIEGSAGMHLGAKMRGGEITVHGNTGDWAGAEMRGGFIHIKGNAGHGLGGAYRGSPRGMNRGLILVDGNAGNEVGAIMRRGLIAVQGDVGDFAGAFMIAGTLVVFGRLGSRPGAGIKRGSIVTFHQPELLPSYQYDCLYRPAFMRLILQNLREHGAEVNDEYITGQYHRYSGDFNALGKGEILVYDQR
jgi:formylmethanofuran dehydrogenase subunit C